MSPQDGNTPYAASTVAAASRDGAVCRTTDTGTSWQRSDKVQVHSTNHVGGALWKDQRYRRYPSALGRTRPSRRCDIGMKADSGEFGNGARPSGFGGADNDDCIVRHRVNRLPDGTKVV